MKWDELSLSNEMIVLIKNVQVCGIRQAMQLVHLHSGKREVRHTSVDQH